MEWGPASHPSAVRSARRARTLATTSGGVAFGLDRGRRDCGSSACQPPEREGRRATLATAGRILAQLRGDPRTIALILVVPLVLMGYANPMTIRGPEWFAAECAKAGVDGVICVDIPSEEDADLGVALRAAGVAPIRLATPTTDAARLPDVLNGAGGFLYRIR